MNKQAKLSGFSAVILALGALFVAIQSANGHFQVGRWSSETAILVAVTIALGAGLFVVSRRSRSIPDVLPAVLVESENADVAADDPVEMSSRALNSIDPTQSANLVRLTPVVPLPVGVEFQSWLGGRPKLPDNVDWPKHRGVPSQFLCQIDCSTLPKRLWDGLGPRTGWLVFFLPPQTAGHSLTPQVLHVDGDVSERTQPSIGNRNESPSRSNQTADMLIEELLQWPVRVSTGPDELPGAAKIGEATEKTDWSTLHDVTLSNPAYVPFDWASALSLLEALKTVLGNFRLHDREAFLDADVFLLNSTAQKLSELTEAFSDAREKVVFSDDARRLLLEGVSTLTVPCWNTVWDETGTPSRERAEAAPLAQQSAAMRAYFRSFERHCRYMYVSDPESLPKTQRSLFEALWAFDARHETGRMGGDVPADAVVANKADPVLLLKLPTSDLLGWMFGNAGSLGVFVAPDALAKGDFGSVWADILGRS